MATSNTFDWVKLGALTLATVVIWHSSKPFRDGLKGAKQSLDAVSGAAGEVAADISAYINGHEPPKFTEAIFFLDEKYVGKDLTVNRQWKAIMKQAHPDIDVLFDEILDVKGRLKQKYQHLINGEVSQHTVFKQTEQASHEY